MLSATDAKEQGWGGEGPGTDGMCAHSSTRRLHVRSMLTPHVLRRSPHSPPRACPRLPRLV